MLAIVGLVLLIAWIIYLRATLLSLGLARGLSWRRAVRCYHLVAGGYWLAKHSFDRGYRLPGATFTVDNIGNGDVLVAHSQALDRSDRRG